MSVINIERVAPPPVRRAAAPESVALKMPRPFATGSRGPALPFLLVALMMRAPRRTPARSRCRTRAGRQASGWR